MSYNSSLTDTQLRATPVPVSGTVTATPTGTQTVSGTVTANAGTGTFAVSGPLTDTQLRATTLPVSLASTTITGTVTVSGPLTDTQLRASAINVTDAGGSLTVDAPVATPVFVRLSDGAAAITTLPVSGTFWQATQPVSLVSQPLPTGAATETTLATLAGVVKAEDSAAVSGDPGFPVFGMRQLADTTSTDADGDYTLIKIDEEGRVKVATKPASFALVTGNITASAQTVFCDVSRASNVMIFMTTASLAGHNVTFEGSIDSTNGTDGTWFGIQVVRSNANTIELTSGVLAATPAYAWEASVNGLSFIRVRATAHTSGTATWKFQRGSYATEPIPAAQISGTQPVSGTLTSAGTTTNTPATPTASIVNSAATTNATSVKASAGTIYSIVCSNSGAAAAFVKIYNLAVAPTVGTSVIALTIPIPASSSVNIQFGALGMRFGTGIALAITNLVAEADATAVAASQVKVLTSYI